MALTRKRVNAFFLIMKKMQIKILGSGTILSGSKRNPSGYLLKEDNSYLLLDCGYGIVKQLINFNEDILKVDTVLISHLHLDHCSDLFPFLMRRHFLKNGSNTHLKISGCERLEKWFQAQLVFQGDWLGKFLPQLFTFKDFEWHGWQIKSFHTGHTEDSLAFIFKKGQKKVFYSADTGFNEDLIEFAVGADVAIIECSFPDDQAVAHHLTPSQLSVFAEEAKINNLFATHIYPENDTDILVERIKNGFSGHVRVLSDGQIIDL